VNREYHRWFSPNLNRNMELLVFGHAGAKALVFPTRAGRFFDYENWGLVGALAEPIGRGLLQLFCVDSVDGESFYGHGIAPPARINRHKQYERYLLNEVVPLMLSKAENPFLIAHGCSIGAYHAVTLALRHPNLFGKVVALSGRYDLTRWYGPFPDLFDGYYDEDIYFHTPNHFLPQLSDSRMLRAIQNMEIVLAVGEQDPFKPSTEELSRQLSNKGVGHSFALWEGEAHKARHWRRMVPCYL
jgi:esterase/lipase superfamily enzyme